MNLYVVNKKDKKVRKKYLIGEKGKSNSPPIHVNCYLQEESVKYKKYFYALRPLLAGEYIQEYQCPPPVSFDDLMKMDMTSELRNGIDELLEIKKRSDDRERGMQIPIIRDFIIDEIGI
jgi:predicted nucleotidyltransferase